MRKRRCPTGKIKYFSREWAEISAATIPGRLRPYHCPGCRWWHLYDKTKRTRKETARETRNQRRRRIAQGES